MRKEIENLIRSTAAMDETIKPEMLELAVLALQGRSLYTRDEADAQDAFDDLTQIVKRNEAAKLLMVKLNTVDYMARIGILVKVYGAGRHRGIGYTRESVRNALKGKVKKHERKKLRH
jgi:hypothetical protein